MHASTQSNAALSPPKSNATSAHECNRTLLSLIFLLLQAQSTLDYVELRRKTVPAGMDPATLMPVG